MITNHAPQVKICPVAPPGAEELMVPVVGYFASGAMWAFLIAGVLAAIMIGIGRFIGHQGLAKGGVIALFVILGAAIAYLVFPGVLSGLLGDGCVTYFE